MTTTLTHPTANPAPVPGNGRRSGQRQRPRAKLCSFLASLGGGDPDVLEVIPGERHRFVKAGCVQLSAAGLSAVSMTAALDMVFHLPAALAAGGGVAWGAGVIAPMDVYLVAMLQRQRSRLGTALLAMPRLLLAVTSAFTVAVPITLALFGSGVNAQVAADNQARLTRYEQQLATQPEYAAIPALSAGIQRLEHTVVTGGQGTVPADAILGALEDRVATLQTQYMAAERQAICEDSGECGHPAGPGPVYQRDVAIADELHTELGQAQQALQTRERADTSTAGGQAARSTALARQNLPALRAQLRTARRDEVAAIKAEKRRLGDGLSERLQALWELALTYPLDGVGHLLVTATLMGFETLPVLAKTIRLLGTPSAYEQAENILREAQVADLRDRLHADALLARRIRQAVDDERVRAETDVARHLYDRWEAEQKALIDLDPARFVL